MLVPFQLRKNWAVKSTPTVTERVPIFCCNYASVTCMRELDRRAIIIYAQLYIVPARPSARALSPPLFGTTHFLRPLRVTIPDTDAF